MAGTLGGLWIALKIGVYFVIMKIRYNPLLEVDLSQNQSLSHPTLHSLLGQTQNPFLLDGGTETVIVLQA